MSSQRNPDFDVIILNTISDRIDDIVTDLREIKQDLKETKAVIEKDVSQLKVEQAGCKSHWNIVGRTIGGSGVLGLIGYVIASTFGKHNP